MPITITGSKNNTTVVSYSNRTLSISGSVLIENDFNDPRIVGIWNNGNYRGMSWVRRFISVNSLELEFDFIDRDGNVITPNTGDTALVSLNYADIVQNGISLNNNIITQTDNLIIGTNDVSDSVCFYDENKQINVTNDGGTFPYQFRGGLFVVGHLLNYEQRTFFNSVDFVSSNNGNNGNQLNVSNLAAKVWWLGGNINFEVTPARLPGGSSGSPAEFQKWWSIETNGDVVTPGGGANWSSNPENQQFVNCSSFIASNNAIGFRIADSDFQGGLVKITGGLTISPFGADAAGTYIIGAPSGQRFNVVDIGTNLGKTSFWRASQSRLQVIECNNIISSDFRLGIGVNPGSNPSTEAVASVNFIDNYSQSINGTVIVINETNSGNEASRGVSSGGVVPLSVNYANVAGHDLTVNETDWNWGAIEYTKNIVFGTFSAQTVNTLDGQAINVSHGANILQSDDILLTELDSNIVSTYNLVNNSNRFYDVLKLFLTENYSAETQTIVSRVLNTIEARNFDVELRANGNLVSFDGNTISVRAGSVFDGNITTTGTVTLNGTTLNGGIVDSNGDSFITFTARWEVYATESDRNASINPLGIGTENEVFRFNFSAGTTYFLWVDGTKQQVTPVNSGLTVFDLSTPALLVGVNNRLGFIPPTIYVNTTLNTNGIGSNSSPFNNIDDAINFANSFGSKSIELFSTQSQPAVLNVSPFGLRIKSVVETLSILVLNGQDCGGSKMEELTLLGDGVASSDWIIEGGQISPFGIQGFRGKIENVTILGNVTFIGNSVINSCVFQAVASDIILDFDSLNINIGISDANGRMLLSNITQGAHSIYGDVAWVTINESCTGGALRLLGTTKIEDNSNGTNVIDETLSTNVTLTRNAANLAAILSAQ